MDPEGPLRFHSYLLGAILFAASFFTPVATIIIASTVIGAGLIASGFYFVPIAWRELPPWRKRRDLVALGDWSLAAGLLPLAAAVGLEETWHVSLTNRPHGLAVALAGFIGGGLAGIVISGLVDWYAVLPRLAGYLGPPPCRSSRDRRWKWVTIGWYLHRALAAIATLGGATGALIIVSTYVLGHINDLVVSEIIAVMGLIAANYKFRLPTAAMLVLNPRVHVGDLVRYELPVEGGASDGYVVDISLEGVKIRDTGGPDGDGGGRFSKESVSIPINKLEDRVRRLHEPYTGCRASKSGCARINWYCRHNPERA